MSMPHQWEQARSRRSARRHTMHSAELDQWTGTDEQRAVTTSDAIAFVRQPERWHYFLDRLRGEVFVRPEPDPLTHEQPPVLPHRYLKLVPTEKPAERLGFLAKMRAKLTGRHQVKVSGAWNG